MDVPGCPLTVIGVAHTARTSRESTPVQAAVNRGEHGTIEIYPQFVEGLAGLADFDYAWLLAWLHETEDSPPLTQVPFLLRPQQRSMGIFATRGPRRVNPLGLSLLQLLDVTGSTITFAGVDVLDGTPVVDLKPYVTRFDRPPGEPRCGWFDSLDIPEAITPADLAPS